MKKLILVAAAAALIVPAGAGAATFKGVVLGKSAHRLVVASRGGTARTVRTATRAHVGAVVSVSARALSDGTFAASRVRVVGRAHRARIHGVVVRRLGRVTVLSAGRSLLALRSGARALASTADSAQPGAVVDDEVEIENDEVDEVNEQQMGQAGSVVVQATITAVAPGSVTLTVGTQSISIPLPAGLVLPQSLVGQTVQLQLSFANGNVTAKEDDDQGDDDQGENDDNDGQGGGGGDDGD